MEDSDRVIEQAAAQKIEAASLLEGMSDSLYRWRPEPQKWSAGEHVVHLTLSVLPYLEPLDRAIEDAGAAAGAGGRRSPREPWTGAFLLRNMEPPPRRRFRTFKRLLPLDVPPREQALAEFGAALDDFAQRAERARQIDPRRARLRSPFVPLIALSARQAFDVVLAHDRRHFWHIRQILERPGRPA